MQDCSISSALALEIRQSYTKQSIREKDAAVLFDDVYNAWHKCCCFYLRQQRKNVITNVYSFANYRKCIRIFFMKILG